MDDVPEPELATDLVEYFVVVLPDRSSLGGVAPAVAVGAVVRFLDTHLAPRRGGVSREAAVA